MNNTTINGALLKEMFLTGAALLEKNKAYVDSLNVFPVPDGDTGTNMSMTMQSAVKEIKACNGGSTVGEVAAAASLGALKGARGNSGVILSQIFRGFAKALKGCEEMDAELLANALRMGTESAYKAVMKPKEGTILTVSRMISTAVEGEFNQGANVFGLIDVMIESGEEALRQTPELLPVLKEAGVVDSGGKGLMTIYRGFKMVVDGDAIDDYVAEQQEAVPPEDNDLSLEDVNDIKFGYCTEFFVIHLVESFTEGDLEKFRDKLMKIGDSVVVAHDADFIKIHVHTNMPGKALQLALCLGELDKVKIENMREQNRAIQENIKKNETENAMVAVSAGEGMDSEFTGAGVGVIISGGQTMNPSIDTIAKAIRKANARNVFVLPNNSNIIMAAQQAAELSDRNVIVIPTKTMMQGMAAAMAYAPENTPEVNRKRMEKAAANVVSGAVTYAVRDTSCNGLTIAKGDIIGLKDNAITSVGKTVEDATLSLIEKMLEDREEAMVTLYFGEGVTEEQANELSERIMAKLPDTEIIAIPGGQPLYYYYISVE